MLQDCALAGDLAALSDESREDSNCHFIKQSYETENSAIEQLRALKTDRPRFDFPRLYLLLNM